MSTIRVDNFAPSGGGTQFPTEGVVKIAARFDTSINNLSDDLNVSSATDNGTGDSTINFTNDMATSNSPTTYSSNTPIIALNFEGASLRRQVQYNLSAVVADGVYNLHIVGDLV